MNDHDLLIRIDERQETLIEQATILTAQVRLQNGRITQLENWKNKAIGAIAALNVVAIPGWIVIIQKIIERVA